MTATDRPRLLPGLDAETSDDPYPYLARMRAAEPVYRDDRFGVYVLTRYADIDFVGRHPELFSAVAAGVGPLTIEGLNTREALDLAHRALGMERRTLMNQDPPEHTRYRKLISKLLNRRRVDGHEPQIRASAHELLDRITGPRFDLARAYSRALPVTTICRELSVRPEDEADFLSWAETQKGGFGNPDVVGQLVALAAQGRLPNPVADYFGTRIRELRAAPGDDLLSAMIQEPLDDGERLTDTELISVIGHFLVAGHDTTTATINNVLLALMRDERLHARVRDDLTLIPQLVDEALRFESPIAGNYRLTTDEVTLGGFTIPQGSVVLLSFSAANRDPDAFPDPDGFDAFRDTTTAHLAFGNGIHFCAGAYLARLQARIGVEAAITRLPGLRLDPPDQTFDRIPNVILRGVETLHVAVDDILPAR